MADMSREGFEQREKMQSGAYNLEHFGAYVAAVVAIAMAVIGLLIGFGQLDAWDTGLAADEVTAPMSATWWDGVLWLIGALSLYMLSTALHQTQHHFGRMPSSLDSTNRTLWAGEHLAAYIAAIAAIALGVIGLLVAYDAFGNDNTVFDGLLWMFASFGASIATVTLHTVGHHQSATEEDYIMSVVERYSTSPRTTGARVPGTERRP
ncbi:MAG: hypothetical protein M0R74_01575 [Dehalococcoidia bacterium]|nr:hypothetical protein [Dehalococcoidia bacterium]